jgi:hypothetical protein
VEYSFIAVRLSFPCATVTALPGAESAGTYQEKTRAKRVKRPETAEMGAGKREPIPNETRHLAVH